MPEAAGTDQGRSAQRRFSRRSLVRKVLAVGGGGAFGQLIVFLASPVLTRLYSPEDFGLYALYASIVLFAGNVACLRFDVAVPVPRSTATATVLAQLGVVSLIAIAILAALAASVGSVMGAAGAAPGISPAFAAATVFLGVVGYGGYQLLNMWAVRHRLYGQIARTRITRAVIQVAIQVVAGVARVAPAGLLMGHALGHLFGLRAIGSHMLGRWRSLGLAVTRLTWTARRYRHYPLLSAPAALLQSASLQVPAVLLMAFYGPAVAGIFAVAQRVVTAPMSMLGSALGMVFMGETLGLARSSPAELRRVLLRSVSATATVGAVPILLLAIGGPSLFALALGDEWRASGSFVRSMAVMYLAQFAIYPASQTLHVLERPGLQLMSDALRLVLGAGGLVASGLVGLGPREALLAYAMGMTVAYGMFLGFILRALDQRLRGSG